MGLSTPTTYNIPKNFIKRSVGFNYNTFIIIIGIELARSEISGSSIDYNGNQRLQPAEALVYFSTDSGASLAQSGFTNGIIQSLPKELNNNI